MPVFSQDNFDNVEPDEDVWVIQQLQPGQRAPRNQFAFRSIDRFNGPSKIFSSARFNFDEDEGIAIATNDIDFVEVKTRTREDFGRPVEAVNAAKRKLIARGALAWLQLLDNPDILVRFDVVEIILAENGQPRFELIRDAFPLSAPYVY